MTRAIVIEKTFSNVDVRCHSSEIVCFQSPGGLGVSLAEHIGHAIDTTMGRGSCADGKCALESVQVIVRIGKVSPAQQGGPRGSV